MPLVLYSFLASPPDRAANLLLKALQIPYERKEINTVKGDQHSEQFQKINPQHTVPTLQDGDFIIWDSHAINAYVVNQYAEDNPLYPRNPKKRAIIDQRLHFDSGVLFPKILNTTRGIKQKTITSVTEDIVTSFEDAYDFVEKFLKGNKYAAGDEITIADFSFVTSLTTMNVIVPIDQQKYPFVNKYLESLKSQLKSYEEINGKGLKEYTEILKNAGFKFLKE